MGDGERSLCLLAGGCRDSDGDRALHGDKGHTARQVTRRVIEHQWGKNLQYISKIK